MNNWIKPKLVSVNTEEYLPTQSIGNIKAYTEGITEPEFIDEPREVSNLPYYIAYHRKLADRLFLHARGKENGLKHVDIRKGFLAIFWIIVFIIIMVINIMMASNLFEQYDSARVATQIKAEQDVMIFPDVTICAKVPFYVDDAKVNNENTTDYDLKTIENLISKKLGDSSLKQTKSNIEAALLIQMVMKQENDFMKAYEHFIYCKYDDKDCSFYNFTEIVHLRYIQCFTFSPNDKIISGNKGLEFIFYKRHGKGKPFVMLNDLEDELFSSDIYDGINVIVHNPDTFPTYAFNYLPTSFALRFGQLATVDVSGLKYKSDMSGRKSCFSQRDPYRYANFRGGANYLEYRYTYEDCIANMKQRYIYEKCNCYSDHLFVPFRASAKNGSTNKGSYNTDYEKNDHHKFSEGSSQPKSFHFCRDIRHKTSHRLRNEFLCFEQYQQMPTTSVLDKFVPLDKLYATRNNLDARKVQRHKVCSLLCEKRIYSTRFFEITELGAEMTLPVTIISHYIKALETSKLQFPELQTLWYKMGPDTPFSKTSTDCNEFRLSSMNLIIVNIRISTELIDAWEEELTETLFNLISNLGGTVGLCSGISVLSSFFLVFFFGRALFHAAVSLILWFWWAVYLGRPPLPNINELNEVKYSSMKAEWKYDNNTGDNDIDDIDGREITCTSPSSLNSTNTHETIDDNSSVNHVYTRNDAKDNSKKFQISKKNSKKEEKLDINRDKQLMNDREPLDQKNTKKPFSKLFGFGMKVDKSSSSSSSVKDANCIGNYEENLPEYSLYQMTSDFSDYMKFETEKEDKLFTSKKIVFLEHLPKKAVKILHSDPQSNRDSDHRRNSNVRSVFKEQSTIDSSYNETNDLNQPLTHENELQDDISWSRDQYDLFSGKKFPYLYLPPPPPINQQTCGRENEYEIYAIANDNYLDDPLQPIIDQSNVPRYLFERYVGLPAYVSRNK